VEIEAVFEWSTSCKSDFEFGDRFFYCKYASYGELTRHMYLSKEKDQ
jgi:hypothetical protein